MTVRRELLEATNEAIVDAVKYADPMVLRGLLYQLTGDESVAATDVATTVVGFTEAKAVGDPSDVEFLQSRAVEFLKSYRDVGADDIPIGPADRLPRSLSLAAGVDIATSELELWSEQLALDPWARGLVWRGQPREERLQEFLVAVIGAGPGGLGAAVQLKQAGIPCVVIEKNSGVGGTWFENRYPGARVDSPSRMYTHTFGADYEYPNPFCEQSENEKYFNWVADHFGVRGRIEFNTEVKSMVWDEGTKSWEIEAVGPDGLRVWRANAVISSVGFLARPNIPDIEGLGTFEGPAFHTARWPSDLELAEKRVAVIGSGCTGYQLVPELAKVAGHTYVFQRTPNWCFDVPGYLSPFPAQVSWLDRNFPYFTNFTRFRLSWLYGPEGVGAAFSADPEFQDVHARSAMNKRAREQRLAFMQRKFANRPELVEKMLPVAPPFSSRPVLVDSEYSIYDVLLRDDVTLISDGIRRVKEDRIELEEGGEVSVDVIVLATGFKANDFLWPMEVRGRGGQQLEQLWEKDGARAYLGTMLPGFPNFFMIYGPNTNATGGLGIFEFEEMVTRFALQCIGHVLVDDKHTVDVTVDAYWRYNNELDRREALKIYRDPRAHNYYQNEHGRSAANSPFDVREMWTWLRKPEDHSTGGGERAPDATVAGASVVRPHFGEDLIVE
ncbi:MAG: SidA/IucD/PvdA family monooxygenase [Acidimicrobiia bacterium]|nr:SidA/IucD/PvdA family monooxygenase [Acidimicrobiia bacterium]